MSHLVSKTGSAPSNFPSQGERGGEKGGKAQRMKRDVVDYGAQMSRFISDDYLEALAVQESTAPLCVRGGSRCADPVTASLSMLTPMAHKGRPYLDSMLTRFCYSAMNKNRAAINSCAYYHHGRRVVVGSQTGEFTVWNTLTYHFENLMQAHSSPIRSMMWSPDGDTLLSGDSQGLIKYSDKNLTPIQNVEGHQQGVKELTFAPSGSKFASCADDNIAKIWDFRSAKVERTLEGHGWDVKSIHWHPEKALIATGSKDANVKLWDPRQSQAVITLYAHKNTVNMLRWSGGITQGQWLITGSKDSTLKLFDIRRMAAERTFRGHLKEVTSVCWHSRDPTVFTSGGYDGQMCHWSVYQQRPKENLICGHDMSVWNISYHPLGHQMVTVSQDQTTRFWSRMRPGDPAPQDLVPKSRQYHEQMRIIEEMERRDEDIRMCVGLGPTMSREDKDREKEKEKKTRPY